MVWIGDYELRRNSTTFHVESRIVEERLRNLIRVYTFILGYDTEEAFQAEIESLCAAVEAFDQGDAKLVITEGRYYMGRRLAMEKTVHPESRFGAFEIQLLTEDRYERSILLHSTQLDFTTSGECVLILQEGNALSFPQLRLLAVGNLVNPEISDGCRALSYSGVVPAGHMLTLDGEGKTAQLDDQTNVLHAVTGEFPALSPGETILTYEDAAESSHYGSLRVEYRDTWV